MPMNLPRDVGRCMGQSLADEMCPKRDVCLRHTDKGQRGDHLSYSAMICRDDRFVAWIPVEVKAGK